MENITIVDNIYRLQEMKDAMKNSIENCEKVLSEQQLMIETLQKSEYAETIFADTIKDISQQRENMLIQKPELENRVTILEDVLEQAKDEKIKDVLNQFMIAIGMFRE